MRPLALAALLALLAAVPTAGAQDAVPSIAAARLASGEGVRLDGRLDDAVWGRTAWGSGFTQSAPDQGAPSRERTEFAVAYDRSALYVAVRAYAQDPGSLVRRLSRRDELPTSDQVFIEIGSTGDDRTGFSFAVNLAGVQQDQTLTNDENAGDAAWDAVWDAATRRFEAADGAGYAVEVRIPFSQLRFDARSAAPWRFNVQRDVAATGETSYWAPILDEERYVSRFGYLTGLRDVRAPRRVEVVPYAAARLTRAPGDAANPFYDANELRPSVGVDAKVGLTSGLTLTATVNPDFGQVEADPAVLNLSQFEDAFAERRPFFVEGTDILSFGRTRGQFATDAPTFFYSRRIGAAPLGFFSLYDDADAVYLNAPTQSTIAAAGKVSGTVGGWSVVLLDAVTTREVARFETSAGEQRALPVSPLTNSLVGRVQRSWRGGVAGAFGSSVLRDGSGGAFRSLLAESATVGGLDAEVALAGGLLTVSGVVAGSVVRGDEPFVERLQTNSARYYQRADAPHLAVDDDREALAGYRAQASLAKTGGSARWRGSLTLGATSPGFEANDLGFQRRADLLSADWRLDYYDRRPGAPWLGYLDVFAFGSQQLNYGGAHINNRWNGGFFARFTNLWFSTVVASYRPVYATDRLTRGGPLALRPSDAALSVRLNTNPGAALSGGLRVAGRSDLPHAHANVDREGSLVVQPSVAWRPSAALRVELAPGLTRAKNTDQFIGRRADAAAALGTRYLFANTRIEQLGVELRADWAFTPDLTLQLYAEPSVFAVRYGDFRQLAARATYDFDRLPTTPLVRTDGGTRPAAEGETPDLFQIDPADGGAAFTIPNRDFTRLALRGNAVLRWEWRPGSTLFLVWQQVRDEFGPFEGLDVFGQLGDPFGAEGQNVFLAKLTYWLGR